MVVEISILSAVEAKLKSITGTGLLIGLVDGSNITVIGTAHCTQQQLNEAQDQLQDILPVPLKLIGSFSSSSSTPLSIKQPFPTIHASVSSGSITYSLTSKGTCTPTTTPTNPLHTKYTTVRYLPEVLIEYEADSAASLTKCFEGVRQRLTGPEAVYMIKAADGGLTLPASSSSFPSGGTSSFDTPIVLTVMQRQSATVCSVPSFEFVPQAGQVQFIEVVGDVVCYVPVDMSASEAIETIIKPAVAAQLTALHRLATSRLTDPSPLRVLCFAPSALSHHVCIAYPLPSPSIDADEESLFGKRKALHALLGLPDDRPLLRVANAVPAHTGTTNTAGTTTTSNKASGSGKSRLADVHVGLAPSGIKNGSLHLVQGTYDYYHYLQDRMEDSGWGCAYRSLQTICSWFAKQHYTARQPPSHKEIQQTLVSIGDKTADFVGSRQWIGAIELGFVLDSWLGVQSKIITVPSGADMGSKARDIAQHFDTQGTPIMIGGGVLAYTLLGIEYNEATGECAFLILDPHYTGSDDLGKIRSGQWIAWKRFGDKAAAGGELFVPDAFYNLLCPQRPSTV